MSMSLHMVSDILFLKLRERNEKYTAKICFYYSMVFCMFRPIYVRSVYVFVDSRQCRNDMRFLKAFAHLPERLSEFNSHDSGHCVHVQNMPSP